MRARHRAAENRFDGAALFLSGRKINGWIHCARQAKNNYEVGKKSANRGATHFFGWRDILRFPL